MMAKQNKDEKIRIGKMSLNPEKHSNGNHEFEKHRIE